MVSVSRIVVLGAVYFAAVFAASYLAGAVPVLWVVPHSGDAEPKVFDAMVKMLMVVLGVGPFLVHSHSRTLRPVHWLGVGVVGLVLFLLLEFIVVLTLPGITIAQYFATRDRAATGIYYIVLGLLALMPAAYALARSRARRDRR